MYRRTRIACLRRLNNDSKDFHYRLFKKNRFFFSYCPIFSVDCHSFVGNERRMLPLFICSDLFVLFLRSPRYKTLQSVAVAYPRKHLICGRIRVAVSVTLYYFTSLYCFFFCQGWLLTGYSTNVRAHVSIKINTFIITDNKHQRKEK